MMAGMYLEISKACAAACALGLVMLIILGLKLHVLEALKKYKVMISGGKSQSVRENDKVRIIKDIVLVHDSYDEVMEGTWELKGESIEGTMDLRLGV